MAARKTKIRHDEETRKKIQASQLINRLTKHALAKTPIMDPTQVRAAEILLKKTLPDLTSVEWNGEISGPGGQPIQVVSGVPRAGD